jgi:uroporphyrinogen decarboxylase
MRTSGGCTILNYEALPINKRINKMNKRTFFKSGMYALGGLGLYAANNDALFAAPKAPAEGGGKNISYLPGTANKREKVLAVLDQSKPNEYIPAAFFMHFKDKLGQGAIDSHLQYFRATNMDFVKVQYEIVLPHLDGIKRPEDWAKIPVYKKDFFEPQLAVIEALAKELKAEALILPTVYSPLSLAQQTVGKDAPEHIRQDPDAVAKGLGAITESIVNYIDEAIKRGADGFYISTQGGNSKFFGSGELFEKAVVPYDKIVSQEASNKALINILHICDYGEAYYEQISQFASYPGSVINTPNVLLDGTPVGLKEVQHIFRRPVMGGLDRLGVLAKGSEEEAKAEVDKVLGEAPPNFILGADCTVPDDVPWQKLRAIIDYAHNWRTNRG